MLFTNYNSVLTSLGLGATAAAANLFGGAVLVQRNWERRYLKHFMALGAGFMLSTALLEMIPASLELGHRHAILLILAGYLLIHFFEHTISPHFHFGEETHHDEFAHDHGHGHRRVSVLVGLLIHTFFDGLAIVSGFLVSNALGWLVFIAIFLHKIPEGFTITSVFLASGSTKLRAWTTSALLGLSTFCGALLMAVMRNGVDWGLPIAAGVTLYVAASDLMPEVNREPSARMPIWVFAGVAAQITLDHLLGGH